MWVYVLIFAVFAGFGLLVRSPKQQNIVLGLAAVFLVVFMGTRFETGCDYPAYLLRFTYMYNGDDFRDYIRFEEPGFHLLNYAIKSAGLDYMWMNVAASFIIVVCLVRFVRLSSAPMLLLALLFPIIIVQLGMSGLRQAIAVGFLLQGVISLIEKKRLVTAMWILLGAQFHESAYIFLPLAFMAGRKISVPKMVISLMVLGPIAAILVGSRLDTYTDRYVDQIYGESESGGATYRYLMVLLPVLLFGWYRGRISRFYPKLFEPMKVFALMIVGLAGIGFVSSVALHRLTYYLMPMGMLILWVVSTSVSYPDRTSRRLIWIPPFFLGAYLLVWFSTSRHADVCFTPYQSFLF
jgi:hypothetical protein